MMLQRHHRVISSISGCMYVVNREGESEQLDDGLDQAGETFGFGCFLEFLSLNADDSFENPGSITSYCLRSFLSKSAYPTSDSPLTVSSSRVRTLSEMGWSSSLRDMICSNFRLTLHISKDLSELRHSFLR